MKKLVTLLVILSLGLKLSAATHLDTTIVSTQKDSLKTTAKHKRSKQATHPDTLNTSPISGKQDSLKLSAILSHSDSLQHSLLTQPDSLKSLNTDSVNLKPGIVAPDSAKAANPATQNDSLKNQPQVIHVHGPSLPISDNYENSPTFYVSIDHPDGPRLALTISYRDTVKQKIALHHVTKPYARLSPVDSLKQQIKLIPSDSLRARMYTKISNIYLKYDTISNAKKQLSYQDHALLYTLSAIHFYSRGNDTLGLRLCFDNLTKVYYDQGKFSEAKWFVLQSIAISRAKRDVPHLVTSLLTLADIKSSIKDYSLATRDLDEALQLTAGNHYVKTELVVLKSYAILYSKMQNYPKEAAMLKRRDSLDKSIQKSEQDSLVAKLAADNLAQKKKSDSAQAKKKVYTSSIKKLSKSNSIKKPTQYNFSSGNRIDNCLHFYCE